MSRDALGAIAVSDPLLPERPAEAGRIWFTDRDGSKLLIDADVPAEPRSLGHLIADIARHPAKAHAARWSIGAGATLQAIVDGLSDRLREQFNTVTPVEGGH